VESEITKCRNGEFPQTRKHIESLIIGGRTEKRDALEISTLPKHKKPERLIHTAAQGRAKRRPGKGCSCIEPCKGSTKKGILGILSCPFRALKINNQIPGATLRSAPGYRISIPFRDFPDGGGYHVVSHFQDGTRRYLGRNSDMKSRRWGMTVFEVPLIIILLFVLIHGGRIGYSYGFHLGGIWGGILGIVIGVLLGIIQGIVIIAVIASPFMIISRVKRVLGRLRNATGNVLEQPCSVPQGDRNNESNVAWNPFQGVSEYGIIVSVFCFFGVFFGYAMIVDFRGFQPGGTSNAIFWLIGTPFLGGLLGLLVGFIFAPVLWVLMKILHFPHWVVSRIIRYVRSKKSLSL
jgi:hypothetical protein